MEIEEEYKAQSDAAVERFYSKLKHSPINYSELPESARPNADDDSFVRVVGVRLNETGRVYDFDAGELPLLMDEPVIVEHEKVLRIGWVVKRPLRFDNSQLQIKFRRIIRRAEDRDLHAYEKKRELEERHWSAVQQMIQQQELPMELLALDYALDLGRVTVYFESSKRVDFRQLLKDLVRELKAKVELRQVGSRDYARMVGALGACGEELCCSRFLNKFHSVTIRMAKEQELSLKPNKVAGMCGRLKCCLAYEFPVYVENNKSLPRAGRCVKCKSGGEGGCHKGVVRELDVLRQLVTVEFDDGTVKRLPAHEVIEENSVRGEGRRDYHRTSHEAEAVEDRRTAADGREEEELGMLEDDEGEQIEAVAELGPDEV